MIRCLSIALLMSILIRVQSSIAQEPAEAEVEQIRARLEQLNERMVSLKRGRDDLGSLADVEIFAKAADWTLRHREYFEKGSVQWTVSALETGLRRVEEFKSGKTPWFPRTGSTVLGYHSTVDGSVQPYAVTLPTGYDPTASQRWPLHVELHGRNDKLTEVRFISQHEGKTPKQESAWIQLDVFGRTNNAYRWAGEADVFEAMTALMRRVRIDESRITLRGFSMGGAGAWHLGLHHPSLWSSVGAGAGFVETVHHTNLKEPLAPLHDKLTRIYDAQGYALNAFDVPTIGYGGELDAQLFAGQTMHAKGEELGVPIPLLIGPKTAHQWHPESLKEFMAFHARHTVQGRLPYPAPAKLKFITYTLKYNKCEWLTIEEQIVPYEPTRIDAEVDASTETLNITTTNASVLQIMRDLAEFVVIDGGKPLPLSKAAGNLLPGVYFERQPDGWIAWDYERSHKYAAHDNSGDEPRKRHELQGPIDDAFMQSFVCVAPTGKPWSVEQTEWAKWTLQRFAREFDQRLRGQVRLVNDTQVTDELIESHNLILFGDPGSNAVLAKIVDKLPCQWTRDQFELQGVAYKSSEHGLAMIYPNPLNPRKYVVINSGHTFHEPEFRASNATLYPRLGDIAVLKFVSQADGGYGETVLFADIFDARWKLSEREGR